MSEEVEFFKNRPHGSRVVYRSGKRFYEENAAQRKLDGDLRREAVAEEKRLAFRIASILVVGRVGEDGDPLLRTVLSGLVAARHRVAASLVEAGVAADLALLDAARVCDEAFASVLSPTSVRLRGLVDAFERTGSSFAGRALVAAVVEAGPNLIELLPDVLGCSRELPEDMPAWARDSRLMREILKGVAGV